MSAIKVGDKVRWSSADRDDIYEVVPAVTSAHACVVAIGESTVHRVPLSELTLVESAPAAPAPAPSLVEEALKQRESLLAENARLREALQMAYTLVSDWRAPDDVEVDGPFEVERVVRAALGIRPSIRHKETP